MEYRELLFFANSSTFFATEDGGTLRIVGDYDEETFFEEENAESQIVRISFALGLEEQPEELGDLDYDSDACHCLLRITDAESKIWEAKSLFYADALLGGLAWENRGQTWRATAFDKAPATWKQAFEYNLLLEGINALFDDRAYGHLLLDENTYDLPFKYASLRFDIALGKNSLLADLEELPPASTTEISTKDVAGNIAWDVNQKPELIVRISGFFDSEMNEVPPFVHAIPCEKLMFYAQTSGLPVPLVFKQVGTAEQPQPIVQYVPHAPFTREQ